MILSRKTFVAFWGKVVVTFFQFDFFIVKTHTTKIAFSYLEQMIIVVNHFLLRKGVNGMALWPFVLMKDKRLKNDVTFLNHEKIHLKQQLELLIIPFYLWYVLEFLLRWIQYGNRHRAYRNISFEREAYSKEKDLQYLHRRSFWRFLYYL